MVNEVEIGSLHLQSNLVFAAHRCARVAMPRSCAVVRLSALIQTEPFLETDESRGWERRKHERLSQNDHPVITHVDRMRHVTITSLQQGGPQILAFDFVATSRQSGVAATFRHFGPSFLPLRRGEHVQRGLNHRQTKLRLPTFQDKKYQRFPLQHKSIFLLRAVSLVQHQTLINWRHHVASRMNTFRVKDRSTSLVKVRACNGGYHVDRHSAN